MTFAEMFEQYPEGIVSPLAGAEQFLAAEFAAMDAGKYHPTVRSARYVASDADPSMAQYDRAIASLSPPESGPHTLH